MLLLLALAIPALLVAGNRSGQFDRYSLLPLVRAYEQAAGPGEVLMQVPSVSFSTDFYAQGRARGLRYGEDLPELAQDKVVYVIIANDRWELLPQELRAQFTPIAATQSHKLFRWPGSGAARP